ncbi:TraB/GumN family protein [Candidatus Woesearchaeota archaeon]|nr:TraB/GumN family protein [Candidatus Woesearchaeota archaeon]
MQYKNLILIGSSHVSSDSINQVNRTIAEEKPGIVAIELDRDRLHALFSQKKHGIFVRGVGFKGMLFAALGAWAERHIGKIVKVEPGSEMKAAVIAAKNNNAMIALIDQHINKTLRRFSETITWTEKMRFLVDIVSGIFTPNRHLKKLKVKKQDLAKVPSKETIKALLSFVKERYPNFYKVLVEERNVVMANNLIHIMKTHPKEKVVAIVGAGHEEGMMSIIKKAI